MLLSPFIAGAEPIASVGYIHSEIFIQKNVSLSIDSSLSETNISSVKYLMQQIDNANQTLNGYSTTDYASTASEAPVISAKVVNDINNLIVQLPYFEVTVQNVSSFDFAINSAGSYGINWGDGSPVETLEKTDTSLSNPTHTYESTGTYLLN